MRFILLFLNLSLICGFHNIIFSKMKISILNNIFGEYSNIETSPNYERDEVYFIGFSNENSSSDLEKKADVGKKNVESPSFIVANNLKQFRKDYGGGFDEREMDKTCLEKIYDQQQEQITLNKLKKYSHQMNLLKKLQNSDVNVFEKLRAIEEYNYCFESSKYISNIESGGLYSEWENINF